MPDRSGTRAANALCNSPNHAVVAEFLASGVWAGVPAHDVVCVETHGALVFLAGNRACKIKRPVRFSYMDFSTLEKRRLACETELRVNRRTAPTLYLAVEPVVRCRDGELRLGGKGEVLEWAVLMRRFPEEDLLDRMAEDKRLTRDTIADLADNIARFHEAAERLPPDSPHGGSRAFREALNETLEELRSNPDWFPRLRLDELSAALENAMAHCAPILDRRKREGSVRRCHGDLHLGNIFLLEGKPTLFDAIEFNDALAWIDVLHDLAFILMDLDHRGMRPFANLLLTRYLMESLDFDGLGALPVLLAERALVRAKVKATAAEGSDDTRRTLVLKREAQEYFDAAAAYSSPPLPCLVAIGGLSGTGKSTLGARLASSIGAAPGAVHLRSDVLRKRLMGVPETAKLGNDAYRPEETRKVYERMMGIAREILATGHSVIVDGVFACPDERRAVSCLAHDLGVEFIGLWLDAPIELLTERVEGRKNDASDATADVVRRQATYDLGTIEWTRITAAGSPAQIEAAAKQLLSGAS